MNRPLEKQHRIRVTVEDIAQVLYTLRKKKAMTQKAVADELEISQSNFSKMENGLLEPSAIQWMTFCQLMGVNPDLLIQEKKKQQKLAG